MKACGYAPGMTELEIVTVKIRYRSQSSNFAYQRCCILIEKIDCQKVGKICRGGRFF